MIDFKAIANRDCRTNEDIAKAVGVSRETIRQWSMNPAMIPTGKIPALAQVCNMSLLQFCTIVWNVDPEKFIGEKITGRCPACGKDIVLRLSTKIRKRTRQPLEESITDIDKVKKAVKGSQKK